MDASRIALIAVLAGLFHGCVVLVDEPRNPPLEAPPPPALPTPEPAQSGAGAAPAATPLVPEQNAKPGGIRAYWRYLQPLNEQQENATRSR